MQSYESCVKKVTHFFAAKVEHCRQSGPINLLQPC